MDSVTENFYEPNGLCSSVELTTERGVPNFETEKELNKPEKVRDYRSDVENCY